MVKCLVALSALFPGAVLAAAIWTWVDEQGQRHYSDREVPGATQIEVGEAQTFSGAALRSGSQPASTTPAGSAQTASAADPAEAVSYSIFDVISPEPDETFRNIAGNLPVSVASFPALQSEHRIDVLLDGERQGLDTRSLEFSLAEVWRGQHTLQALIVDADGAIIMRSPAVTFFVQQTSIQN